MEAVVTPSQIRQAYEAANDGSRHFFDHKTMKWFGDTMRSYGTRTINGTIYMYRKADARANVFGTWRTVGRDFFNAWRFNPATADLDRCDNDTTQMVWDTVYRVVLC